MQKRAFEKTGLIPRSIIRTFDRFKKQLLYGSENVIIQEFRISRYQVLVSVKCLVILVFVPLLVNFFAKNFLFMPFTKYVWNTKQNEIFLNLYQQNRAFKEMKNFEEEMYFESLVHYDSNIFSKEWNSLDSDKKRNEQIHCIIDDKGNFSPIHYCLQQKFQKKTISLAIHYNQESIESITNLFGDFVTFATISFLFVIMKPQIIILKSFLIESLYSLSDTTKSFLLILFTDLLVGFHSPKGWEVFIELVLRHFGLPENEDFIFLFVATFPVLLDTVFKYWIFRYLNKISPSTVATYHSMIE